MQRFLICTLMLGATAAAADLPLFFEPNQGQSQPGVEFLSRGNGVTSNLNASAAEFPIGHSTVRMQLAGAAASNGEGLDRLPGKSSYFIGNDSHKWHTGIPQYGRVRYRDVYPGVDLVYYGNHGKLEYDFVIAPGARPSDIHVVYSGLEKLRVGRDGSLLLKTASGEIRQLKPVVYQEAGGQRKLIAASYRLGRDNRVGFELGRFDARLPLVVDPVLEYGTYFGDGFDNVIGATINATKVDAAGNIYMTGAFSPTDGTPARVATVVKFSPSQNQILYWASYGTGNTVDHFVYGLGLAIDSQGSAYISSETTMSDVPTVNAFQSQNNSPGMGNGVVAKFAPDGQSLVYSTYLGGHGGEWLRGIAVDSSGNAYVTGQTLSSDFPVRNAIQNSGTSGTILAKFSPTGTLLFSTYFNGSSGFALAVDSAGNPILAGTTSAYGFPTTPNAYKSDTLSTQVTFVSKFTPEGQVTFSALYGSDLTTANQIVLDAQNNIYLAGGAYGAGLPAVNALMPQYSGRTGGFLAKLSADGSQLLYSTYFGGNTRDDINGLAVDATGNILVAGTTYSSDFPLKNSLVPFTAARSGYTTYGFLTKIGPDGRSLVYSTLIGGSQGSSFVGTMSLTPSGAVYLSGRTSDTDFSLLKNGFRSTSSSSTNAFLLRLNDGSGDTPTPYTEPGQGVVIAVSPDHAMFNFPLNGSPASQTFTVTSTPSGTSFSARAATVEAIVNGVVQPDKWLSVTSTSATAPAQLTVTADPAGMAVGTYFGSIVVSPAAGMLATFNVAMMVTPGSTAIPVSISPTSLAFSVSQGGTATAQTLTLSASSGSAAVNLSASTASGGNWLTVSPSSGTTVFQPTVSVNAQGLAAGTYSGSILATPQGGSGTSVPVTLTVTAPSTTVVTGPAIASVTPATLTSNQQNQVVTVKGSGFSSQTAVSIVFGNYEFPAKLTPVTVIDSNTLSVTVRGMFLFQPDSLGLRLTNPGAAGSAGFAIAVQ